MKSLKLRDGHLVKAGTTNLEAYQLYAKGRGLLARCGLGVEYVDCFEQAVKLDPNYGQAWAALADSYTALGYFGLAHPQPCMPRALEAARRAVRLDPWLAEAHTALAMASLMGAWDRVEANWQFLRALERNPRYIPAREQYALFHLMLSEGRSAEAMAEAKRALESDPLSSFAHLTYGFICACAGEYAQAVQTSQRAVELDSESYLARYVLQTVLYFGKRFEESVLVGESALAMSGRHHWAMVQLGLTFADWGKPADAEAIYTEMLDRSQRQYLPPAALSLAAAAAAKEEDAVRHAREACAVHDPHCLFFFSRYVPTITGRLYDYPGFREIIAGVGRSNWLRGRGPSWVQELAR